MQKRLLRKIVGQRVIASEFTQEVPDLRLMAAHQFAERAWVLFRDHLRDEVPIYLVRLVLSLRLQDYDSRFPIRHMIM